MNKRKLNKSIKKTQAFQEDFEKKRIYMINAMKERNFNYYFDEGTDVTIDGEIALPDGDINNFYPSDLTVYVGKKGTVIKVTKDLHAFGQGAVYFMDIDFGDKVMRNISATLIIPYKV